MLNSLTNKLKVIFNGFLGGIFDTMTDIMTSLENIDLLRVTRVASRNVTLMVALLMIFCSILGKFLTLVSFSIVVAWYCIFDCHIVSSVWIFLFFFFGKLSQMVPELYFHYMDGT
jgi:hypothetical protein